MTFTGMKTGLFGYNKKDVCLYVSDLNSIHDAKIKAAEEKLLQQGEELGQKNDVLTSENKELKDKSEELSKEISELKTTIEKLEAENSELKDSYNALENEVSDLREKSNAISSAIINAEKCAGTLIEDAKIRANDMVSEAESKVSAEVKRLETARHYIGEIKSSVSLAMKNIENALGNIETDIENKKSNIEDGEIKKNSVKEKFEVFEKNLFKRA